MANLSKARGTAAETAVVRWLRDNGFSGADRQPLRGSLDQGDIALCPGVIAEIKAVKAGGTGQPGPGLLTDWMRQTEAERDNACADVGILIVKRTGTADVGRWWAYVTAWTLTELIYPARTSEASLSRAWNAPVCLTVADLVALLRAAGWGDSLEDGAA